MCYIYESFFCLNSSPAVSVRNDRRVNQLTRSVCWWKTETSALERPPSVALFGLVKHQTCYRFWRENTYEGFIESGAVLPSGGLQLTRGQFSFTRPSESNTDERGNFEKSNFISAGSFQGHLCISLIIMFQKNEQKNKREKNHVAFS